MVAATPQRAALLAMSRDGRLLLECSYDDRDRAKLVPGWTWQPDLRAWSYAATRDNLAALRQAFPELRVRPEVDLHFVTPAAPPIDWHDAEPVEPIPLKIPLYRHQVAAFNHCLKHRHAALFMQMRTGKTPTAIAALGRRFLRGEIQRALIVAPTSVLPEWKRQLEEFAAFPYSLLMLDSTLTIAGRIEKLQTWRPPADRLAIVVLNYESLARAEEQDGVSVAVLLKPLRTWKPQAIVADETQRIKNRTARAAKVLHALSLVADYRLGLTGTPVTQGAEDLFSQYKFLDRGILGDSFAVFRASHLQLGGYKEKEIVGYRNLDILTEKVHSIAFRVRLIDTYDMPPELESRRYCALEPAAARVYRQLVEESAAELGQLEIVTADNILTRLLRLQQTTGGFLPVESGKVVSVSTAKLELLEEVVTEALDGDLARKVVVFARFLPEVAAIRDRLTKLGLQPVVLAGGERDRGGVVSRFRNDPAVRAFIGQIQTAGVGIPLDVADTAVYYSTTFSFADYDQARSRIKAVGKATPRQHVSLLVQGSVDEHIVRALTRKRNVADDVVDRWRELFHAP